MVASMMKKREEEEEEQEQYPVSCFYIVQSPSSVSSSTCPHQHHHHRLNLTPKPLPTTNPLLDHNDDNDDDDDHAYMNNNNTQKKLTTIINISNTDMSCCCSSRVSLTSMSLDNDNHDKKLDIIPLLPPNNNHNHNHNDEGSTILVNNANNNNNNEAHSSFIEKFGQYPHLYHHKQDEEQEEEDKGWWKYLSIKTYPTSNLWIAIQLLWRLLFSMSVALLVFYIATKPPPPFLSLQVARVKELEVTEGVDRSGVETNLLTCNISMLVSIENKSKLFPLHLHPLRTSLYYRRIPLVLPRQQSLEEDEKKVKNEETKEIRVSEGVRGMAMYGAGRDMQDALRTPGKTKTHLELVATLWVHSYYKIIPNLIHPNFHHKAYCVLSIHNSYDHNHGTQAFNTTCRYFLS